MHIEEILLNDLYPHLLKNDQPPRLRAFIHKGDCRQENETKFPAMLICPGGGYAGLSPRESDPVAAAFYARGFNCYILHYTCKPAGYYPTQLLQAAAAVHLIRTNREWNNTDHVSVIGFSAGGHLAGHIATCWHQPFVYESVGCTPEELRIDALILSYAVTVFEKDSHQGSFVNLLGGEPSAEDCKKLDLRNFIDKETTPPTFLWHTDVDPIVPMEDTLRMSAALHRAGVPQEMHIFPGGDHGIVLSDRSTGGRPLTRDPYIRPWTDMVLGWEKHLFPNDFD